MTSETLIVRAIEVAGSVEEAVRGSPAAAHLLDTYPRDMAAIVSLGLGVAVRRLPGLTITTARTYVGRLRKWSVSGSQGLGDRRIYGLLHVGPPCNLILVSLELSAAAANYVIAHELGHYFADLMRIRRRWLEALPEGRDEVIQAFDWLRPTGELELTAVIKGLPPIPAHILGRGRMQRPETLERELLADLIARQLLAPWSLVAPLVAAHPPEAVVRRLREQYGLPTTAAADYDADIRRRVRPEPDVLERLFGLPDHSYTHDSF